MSWWGICLLVLGCATGSALLTWLLTRGGKLDVEELMDIQKRELQKSLEAERVKNQKIMAINRDLQSELQQQTLWMEDKLREIDDKFDKDYQDLANNRDTLMRRIDRILGRIPKGSAGQG